MIILTLETSTTSAKAMLYDSDTDSGETLTRPFIMPERNQMNADVMVSQTLDAGREIAQGKHVDAISVSSVWHSLILRSHDYTPLSPVLQWDNTEAAELCSELKTNTAWAEQYYRNTGCVVNAIYPAFKIKYLSIKDPGILKTGFMSIGSYMTWILTGQMVSTRCLSSGSGLLNITSGEYDDEVLSFLNISSAQLSPLIDSDISFPLTEKAAKILGLPAGIPVIPANSDGALNQVGSGALKGSIATLSLGTSGAIRMACEEPVIPEKPSTWCYRSPVGILSGAATNGCCNCIDWAKNNLFLQEMTYEEIEKGDPLTDTPPVFLPFLFGERCPGWDSSRRGGFTQLRPEHTVYDMYRAVQEGVLFNLYQCYEILARSAGSPSEIMISGGILKSSKWLQMAADIFGCPLKVSKEQQQSLLGASVLAAWVQGAIDDIRDYKPETVRQITPDRSMSGVYRERFARYLEAYRSF